MLILTRRARSDETLLFFNDDEASPFMRIEIVSIKGNQARISIDAPENITVLRNEVHERNQKEQ